MLRTTMCRIGVAIVIASAVVSSVQAGVITNIPMEGYYIYPFECGGVNNNGQVAASAYNQQFDSIAMLYSGGTTYDLGTIGGEGGWAAAHGINASGQVVGRDSVPINPPDWYPKAFRGFISTGIPGSGGTMQDLGTFVPEGGSTARAINDNGDIAGDATMGGFFTSSSHAMLITGGIFYDLGTLAGAEGWSTGTGINASRQIVGTSSVAGGGESNHAFLYTGTPGVDGHMFDLGTLGGAGSMAEAINASGRIVGTSDTTGDMAYRGFLYIGIPGAGGQMYDLGTFGGSDSNAMDINDGGQIVGWASDIGDNDIYAFLYLGTPGAGGRMVNLNTWLHTTYPAEGAGWVLEEADAISNNGWIAGLGTYNGKSALWLLDASSLLSNDNNNNTAVPEPATIALLSLAAGGIGGYLRRRRTT